MWWAFVTSDTEIIIAANDLEQSVGRVFQIVVKLLEHNPDLGLSAKVRAADIVLTNGTTISAIASDYKGAAGSRHSLVVFDELWGYSLEAAQRLFEELTPPPTEENAWLLIVTYAGWSGESVLLERLYKQGLAGKRIDDELELYQANELFMFWSHTPRQPWQTERYYAEQRRSLRPNTYARLHENKWVSGESAFITPELWDPCVDHDLTPLLLTHEREVIIGIDIGIKSDNAAVEGVYRDATGLVQALHRLWKPSRAEPLDLQVVEEYVLNLRTRARIHAFYDPHQFHGSAMRLRAAGVSIDEFPQTSANCTRMGQTLFELLTGKHLRLLPFDDLRTQALNTIAIENARGWRIAKERASRKIDGIVALSMACVGALDQPVSWPLLFSCNGVRLGGSVPVSSPIPVSAEPARPQGAELLSVPKISMKFLTMEELQERQRLQADAARQDTAFEAKVKRERCVFPGE